MLIENGRLNLNPVRGLGPRPSPHGRTDEIYRGPGLR